MKRMQKKAAVGLVWSDIGHLLGGTGEKTTENLSKNSRTEPLLEPGSLGMRRRFAKQYWVLVL
jgi:hypothetical protein